MQGSCLGHSQLLGLGSVLDVAMGPRSCSSHSSSPTQSEPLILIFLVSPVPLPVLQRNSSEVWTGPACSPSAWGEMKSQDTQNLGHSCIWEPGEDPGPARMLQGVGKGGMSMELWWIEWGDPQLESLGKEHWELVGLLQGGATCW